MLKILLKMLSGISHEFHLLCSSVFPLCLHCAPSLTTFLTIYLGNLTSAELYWNIFIDELFIKVFHDKVTVLLESIDLRSYVQCI